MPDIEGQLRTAMHAAVDNAEATPDHLIREVMRRHRRATARRNAAAILAVVAIAVPLGIAVTRSGSSPVSPPAASSTKVVTKMSGQPVPAGMKFGFLETTLNGAGWYSTATQQTQPIAGLPAVIGGYRFERLDGGWAATPMSYNSPCPVNECAGPPAEFYFIAYGSTTATRIGQGYAQDGVDPGFRAGTIWLVTYPRSSTSISASSFAQLVSTAGRALGPRYRLPANTLMGRGVGRYLLLVLDTGAETHSELWDPATGHVLGHFDNVIAQGPDQVVWSNGCKACRLEITDVTTGKTVTTSISGAQPAKVSTAISDDGRLVAVQLPGQDIVIVNTKTGATTRIAGTALSSADFEYFDWQNSGHRLIITAGPTESAGPDQIAYWQPGETGLHVTTTRSASELPDIETGNF